MPTVIDSLIVELGLDPSIFTKGQAAALSAFRKTGDEATKTGKLIEDSSKKAAEAVSVVTKNFLSLFAVLLGARGLKEFIADLTTTEASLGRFAKNLGVSAQTVDAMQKVAERFGGTSDATSASLEKVSRSLYDLRRNGQAMPREFAQLAAATGRAFDTTNVVRFTNSVAGALKQMAATDPNRAHFLAQGLGYDDATAASMMAYGDAFSAYVDKVNKSLSPSAQAIKAAQELQQQWVTLKQTAQALGYELSGPLEAAFGPLLIHLADWLAKNKELIDSKIAEYARKIADYIATIDLTKIVADVESFATQANSAATAIGGWKVAAEALFALWLGSKFLAVLANARALAAAAGAAAAGGAGAAAALATAGIGLYEAVKPQPTNEGEPQLGPDGKYHRANGSTVSGPMKGNTDVTADGRPVSKSNPLPVIAQGGGDGVTGMPGIDGSTPRDGVGGGGTTPGDRSGATTGGVGGGATPGAALGARTAVNMNIPPEGRALLDVLASGEAKDYNVLNGGGTFSDYSRHPGGRAAGRYQFLPSTWAGIQRETGISDFSPTNQDRAAWYLAQRDYRRNSGGRDLDADLKSNDPNIIANVGRALHSTWISLNGSFTGKYGQAAARVNAPRDPLMHGTGGTTPRFGVGGASGAAALSTIANTHNVTTSQTSAEMKVGTINVNAPNATDAAGVASAITGELQKNIAVMPANYGQR